MLRQAAFRVGSRVTHSNRSTDCLPSPGAFRVFYFRTVQLQWGYKANNEPNF